MYYNLLIILIIEEAVVSILSVIENWTNEAGCKALIFVNVITEFEVVSFLLLYFGNRLNGAGFYAWIFIRGIIK